MKKLLLGTSALIGATAMVASAQAAPELTISGNLDFRLVGGETQASSISPRGTNRDVGSDNVGYELTRANSRSEIRFRAHGESDGGTVYGASIDYRYAASSTDEAYVYVGGDWGRVHLGDDDGAVDARVMNAGWIAPGAFLIDDTTTFINMEAFDSSDATKISYFSPDYNGFQFAGSIYESVGSIGAVSGQVAFSNVFEIAASYGGSFAGIDYAVAIGSQTGSLSDAVTANTGLNTDVVAARTTTATADARTGIPTTWYTTRAAAAPTAAAPNGAPVSAGNVENNGFRARTSSSGNAQYTAEYDDLAVIAFGLQLGYGPFSFVASYNDAGDSGTLTRIGQGTADDEIDNSQLVALVQGPVTLNMGHVVANDDDDVGTPLAALSGAGLTVAAANAELTATRPTYANQQLRDIINGSQATGREFYSLGVAFDVGGGMAIGASYGEASHSNYLVVDNSARNDAGHLTAAPTHAAITTQEHTQTLYTIDFGFPIMEGMSGYAGIAFSEYERAAVRPLTITSPGVANGAARGPAVTGPTLPGIAAPSVRGLENPTASATDPGPTDSVTFNGAAAASTEATTYVIGTTISF